MIDITKKEFAKIISDTPSLSLQAYMICPTVCCESYDKCVVQIRAEKCLRYEQFQLLVSGKVTK